ncbi:SUKH-4 family immunity protein [Streptomyces sp. NBC_01218]|uniref:nucleic acid/nucleotide deaminase domain-containing protein n=1 Tax=unclassified Streptomyces TaxID=2593676 RepID=UPI002E12E5A4|nr:SUKH-4 family immunity protein [Streptomyces sp. NBC_01218]
MSEPTPEPSVAHFGASGMRRIVVPRQYATLPGLTREVLATVGVPLHVHPYFTAAGETDGLTLRMFAGHRGLVLEDPRADWVRLGSDRLAQLCVRPDGGVQAVFLARPEPDLFVASDVRAFTATLAAFDRRLPVIVASSGPAAAAAAYRELDAELRRLDPEAFDDRESWWPRVLEDVRHTLNFPFSSAFEYVDGHGGKTIATERTAPGRAHPEELLWARLSADGVTPDRVRRVYCELEPCMMPGHYCSAWLQATFPHAEFTHSFDYGDAAAAREEGLRQLILHAARQAGPA